MWADNGYITNIGYVVNGFKFQTEAYCRRKSTSNYGVSIKGSGLAQPESNFFGTLQEVVDVEYPNVPIKKVILFKCEWFDPTQNVGSRFNSEYGIAEVHCNKRYRKYDHFIIAQSTCQVLYSISTRYKEENELVGSVECSPRGAIDSAYRSNYTYQQDNTPLPTYGCDQSIHDNVKELVHEPLQMNEVVLPQSENQLSDQGVQTEDSEEESSKEIEEDDNDIT
nr:uncharacterized protein LOC109190339 [Ipomoea trifida]